ncbi:hypothetical protein F7R91_14590 [Streptomyces luteolifulvus]|uniref:Uncharacterized protein n=1 Tax=Streptomyces luteolifulvus TaxID=2615112 RepID=A0A6H9V2E1_9ACTN|nr:hypothetical protein [Streptomyces luteolifulvus]KAB1146803.1 hypothetical protein F7R91_14590 [Streptomyces luteolifulvus]
MGQFIDRLIGTKEARAKVRAAQQHLEEVSAGITEETDEYLAANQAVIDAEEALPRWRRGPR